MPGGKYRSQEKRKLFVSEPAPYPDTELRKCRDIVREAQQRDLWIYDPSTKGWYSPTEFADKFERIHAGNETMLKRVQLKDPVEGLQAGYKRMLDLQIKLEDFTKRVLDYYRVE